MRRCLCLDSAPLLVSAGYSAKHIISQISRISATLAEYKHFRVRCRTNEHVITRRCRILLLQLSVYACLPACLPPPPPPPPLWEHKDEGSSGILIAMLFSGESCQSSSRSLSLCQEVYALCSLILNQCRPSFHQSIYTLPLIAGGAAPIVWR